MCLWVYIIFVTLLPLFKVGGYSSFCCRYLRLSRVLGCYTSSKLVSLLNTHKYPYIILNFLKTSREHSEKAPSNQSHRKFRNFLSSKAQNFKTSKILKSKTQNLKIQDPKSSRDSKIQKLQKPKIQNSWMALKTSRFEKINPKKNLFKNQELNFQL